MPIWLKARFYLEYLVLRGLVELVRLMSLDTATRVSAWAWRTIAPRTRRHHRALQNLTRAFPEKSDTEIEDIARAMWANLGRVMAETMQMDRLLAEPDRIAIVDPTFVDRYANRNGAAIFAGLHMGNWELAMWPLTRAGASPAAVYRIVNNPYVDAYLREQRKDLYPGGLFAKGRGAGSADSGHMTARRLAAHLGAGGRLGFLCDLHDGRGVKVPFFGQPAPSTPVAAMLATRMGVRLWVGRCVRQGEQSRFRVEVRELHVPRTGDAQADTTAILTAMHAQFEAWIREYPEQWMWSNRRWA